VDGGIIMYFIEVSISNAKALIAVSEIVQVFKNKDGNISIVLKNGDIIVTQNSYEEIRSQIQPTLIN
jgi:ubiquinone biosynthesis protein Coq4